MSKVEYSIISVENQKIFESEIIMQLESLFIGGLKTNVKVMDYQEGMKYCRHKNMS